MKKVFFFALLVIGLAALQSEKIIPHIVPARQSAGPNIENIPAFRILSKDSVYISNANLKKDKPVMIIYFSPDCSHCQRLMYEMKPEMKNFEGVQIVMVTFTPSNMLVMMRNFYRDFSLSAYPNIMMGTEYPKYEVQRYYQVETTPYIAVYNRKGKLVKAFAKAPKMDELVAAVKKT